RQRDRPVLISGGGRVGWVLQRVDTHGQRGSGVLHDGEAAVDADDSVESDGGQRGAGDVGDGHGDDRGGGGATDADGDGDVLPVPAAGGGLRVGRDAGGDGGGAGERGGDLIGSDGGDDAERQRDRPVL